MRPKKYQKWPGLRQSAKNLGVTYEHLRAVVAGKRESQPLLTRYNQLQHKTKIQK